MGQLKEKRKKKKAGRVRKFVGSNDQHAGAPSSGAAPSVRGAASALMMGLHRWAQA